MKWRIDRARAIEEKSLEEVVEQIKCYARMRADMFLKKVEDDFDILFIPFTILMVLFLWFICHIGMSLAGVSIYVYLQ